MLTRPTHDRLVALGLIGMAKALEEQRKQPDMAALSFEERLALMVDREAIERENKRLVSRLKFASLRQSAVVEDVDMKAPLFGAQTVDAALDVEQRVYALDRLQRDRRDRRRRLSAPDIGGNVGQLEELTPRMSPAQCRRDRSRSARGIVKLVIPAVGVGLQDAGDFSGSDGVLPLQSV